MKAREIVEADSPRGDSLLCLVFPISDNRSKLSKHPKVRLLLFIFFILTIDLIHASTAPSAFTLDLLTRITAFPTLGYALQKTKNLYELESTRFTATSNSTTSYQVFKIMYSEFLCSQRFPNVSQMGSSSCNSRCLIPPAHQVTSSSKEAARRLPRDCQEANNI